LNKKNNGSLGKKFYITVGIIILIIIGVIIWSAASNKKRNENNQTVTSDQFSEKETSDDDEQSSSGFLIFDVSNRKEHIDPAMGNWAYKMNEALASFVMDNYIDATSAESIESNIPAADKSLIEFYLELNNEEKTMVIATYNTVDRSVMIEITELSKEEIKQKVQMPNGEPAIRDVQENAEENAEESAEEN